MNIEKLWDDLVPLQETKANLKKDYERGITPYLPYFVIGQHEVKQDIGSKIQSIDIDKRLMTTFVLGEYGNGKSNLLDYLRLYARENHTNISVLRMDANVDKPDIFMMLLYLLEVEFIEKMIPMFQKISNAPDPLKVYMNCALHHKGIYEYIKSFVDFKLENQIKELIFLGTGRLYAKADWKKYGGMKQLTNYERRDVLSFFLNIIRESGEYIIFEIDEIEKIREKSKIRFFNFLTSYRELIDQSHFIMGHLLITTMTISKEQGYKSVLEDNPAFLSRVQNDVKTLGYLSDKDDQKKLVSTLATLFDVTMDHAAINDVVSQVKRRSQIVGNNNRALVKDVCRLLQDQNSPIEQEFDLQNELKVKNILNIYDAIFEELKDAGDFNNIDRRMFDPLSGYLSSKGYSVDDNLKRQDKVLRIPDEDKALIWNFSKDTLPKALKECNEQAKVVGRIYLLKADYDVSWEDLQPFEDSKIEVIEFNPRFLMTLLVMYTNQPTHASVIDELIVRYLKGSII